MTLKLDAEVEGSEKVLFRETARNRRVWGGETCLGFWLVSDNGIKINKVTLFSQNSEKFQGSPVSSCTRG